MPEPDATARQYFPADAELVYHPRLFSVTESTDWFRQLMARAAWSRRTLKLYGREIPMPRLIAWYADPGIDYRYSGQTAEHNDWIEPLITIRRRVEQAAGARFNGALLNAYRDGRDSMSWHSDDEPELGQNPVVASVSLGGPRRFKFRHRHRRGERFEIDLEDGSLLIMRGPTQHYWQHAIPKTKKPVLPRINITFRRINKGQTTEGTEHTEALK